jgi:6,7-dimethyl-8-ribityllumazine synthase
LEQAVARTGHGAGNKGWEAALAVLEMSGLKDALAGKGLQ